MIRPNLALLLVALPMFGQPCAPAPRLQPVDSVTGALDGTTCNLSDGTPYVEYALRLAARGQLQLDGASGDFPVALILRDGTGHKIDAGANIHRAVERGSYTVRVNAAAPGQTGKFTLKSNFAPEAGTLCRSYGSIGLNQNLTASLSTGSCRLPDTSPYDGYSLTTFGSGTVQISLQADGFDPYLILRSSDGHLLVANDGGGAGSTAQLSYSLLGNQVYTVVASAGDSGTGTYQISVAFTPADNETCRPVKTLNPGDKDPGTIAASGCQYQDASSGQQFPFNWYNIQVPNDGLADLRVSSNSIDPTLWLIDPSGNVMAADTESGGKGLSMVQQQLKPGKYTVLVFSGQTGGGSYTLQYAFTPGLPANCPVLSLDPGNNVTGKLDPTATCRTTEGLADVYRFTTTSAGTVSLAMVSGDFYPYLILWDEKDNRLVADSGAINGNGSQISADLPPGTYAVLAATLGGAGGYTMGYRLTPHDLAACGAPATLQPPGYIGILGGSASCPGPNGQPQDGYQFTLSSDATVAVVMSSQYLDSFVNVQDGQSNTVRWDDDSLGQGDALIVQFLPAGTYRVGARALESSNGGLYEVDLRVAQGGRPTGCQPLQTVSPGETLNAQLTFVSCQYPDDTFADVYRFNLAAAGQIEIDMNSTDFDTYLLLLDGKGNVLYEDDNGGGAANSRINRMLDAGTYFVVAKPYAGYSSQGNYTLAVLQK